MGKLVWILLLGFCLIVSATPRPDEDSDDDAAEEDAAAESGAESDDAAEATEEQGDEEGESDDSDDSKEFVCNLKFKRIGCYADKGKKDKPLVSFMESDEDLSFSAKRGKIKGDKLDKFNGELPKFACKCANDAINGGNAIFGLQNLAECWSGPDDSKYDKDGPSEDCVTFDMAKCEEDSEVCAGKKHANFMYYVDSPEHTKTKEEVQEELAENAKKEADAKKKAAKKLKGKKKGKKSKKSH